MEEHTLTVADLISIRNLIDAACARGTFKANEMASVGEIYNRLNAFVAVAQQNLQQEPPADQEQPAQPPGDQNA